jgi:hypothetical protein
MTYEFHNENTNLIYVHVVIENSVTNIRREGDRGREIEKISGLQVDTGFIMPFRFKALSVEIEAESIDIL